MPDALLDEVTALVEWPAVYAGTFDRAFLDVPQECLILTMQQNQKYFALADDAGKLKHRFLLVSNIETQDPAAIIQGNERVLRARLADAKFFYDQDRKTPLAARVDKLRGIVYHNKLGTQADRTARLRLVASRIAPMLGADPALADRAALLAKADLVTDMVGEFPELQGTMGRYYAQHDGEAAEVADAIAEHYLPRYAGDALPAGGVAQSRRSRRQARRAGGNVRDRPAADRRPRPVRPAPGGAGRHSHPDRKEAQAVALRPRRRRVRRLGAAARRCRVRARRCSTSSTSGCAATCATAATRRTRSRPSSIPARLHRRSARAAGGGARVRGAARGAVAFRRQQAHRQHTAQGARAKAAAPSTVRCSSTAPSVRCTRHSTSCGPIVESRVADGDFSAALQALASTKPTVDRFFDDVMVMADDPKIRGNRLALLREVAATMNHVADISKLVV